MNNITIIVHLSAPEGAARGKSPSELAACFAQAALSCGALLPPSCLSYASHSCLCCPAQGQAMPCAGSRSPQPPLLWHQPVLRTLLAALSSICVAMCLTPALSLVSAVQGCFPFTSWFCTAPRMGLALVVSQEMLSDRQVEEVQ